MNSPGGLQKVIEHFQRNGWKYQLEQDRPVLRTGFGGKNGVVRCVIAVDESDDLIQVLAFLAVVPEQRRAAAADLCQRASYGIKLGKFELDHNDGELRFQAGAPYVKGELNEQIVQRLLGVCLLMADAYLSAFMKVVYANVSPAEAASDVSAWLARGGKEIPEPELPLSRRVSFN